MLAIPSYWDPRRRSERVDLTRVPQIRFLTEDDFPPYNFAGPDGRPTGFNVELARAICQELGIPCTIQVRRFDVLTEGLDRNTGDAIIASMAITPDIRRRYEVSDRYLETPARFVMRKDTRLADATPEALAGRSIAVVQGTAHEAYVAQFFRLSSIRRYPDLEAARRAVLERDVDVMFADGIASGFWIAGESSADCCRFLGGAFTENRFFGEGLAVGHAARQRAAAAGGEPRAAAALGKGRLCRAGAEGLPDGHLLTAEAGPAGPGSAHEHRLEIVVVAVDHEGRIVGRRIVSPEARCAVVLGAGLQRCGMEGVHLRPALRREADVGACSSGVGGRVEPERRRIRPRPEAGIALAPRSWSMAERRQRRRVEGHGLFHVLHAQSDMVVHDVLLLIGRSG
jgi:polar amino acid transport system substrate-binding protein